jgi:hypothetical protein
VLPCRLWKEDDKKSPKREVFVPSFTAWPAEISAIRAETWQAINQTVLQNAREEKFEVGSVIRLDSTVTAALMHQPSDSSLLRDAVRVMARLLEEADTLTGGYFSRLLGMITAAPPRSAPAPSSSPADDRNLIGRRDVVAWREVGFGQAE